jgi:predicted PurR-regulated permease PerM
MLDRIRASLKRLIGRVINKMKLQRDWWLIAFGFIFTTFVSVIINYFGNYTKLLSYGMDTVWVITISLMAFFMILALITLYIIKIIRDIDKEENRNTKVENDKRDINLIETFRKVLKENNTDLANEIVKAMEGKYGKSDTNDLEPKL